MVKPVTPENRTVGAPPRHSARGGRGRKDKIAVRARGARKLHIAAVRPDGQGPAGDLPTVKRIVQIVTDQQAIGSCGRLTIKHRTEGRARHLARHAEARGQTELIGAFVQLECGGQIVPAGPVSPPSGKAVAAASLNRMVAPKNEAIPASDANRSSVRSNPARD